MCPKSMITGSDTEASHKAEFFESAILIPSISKHILCFSDRDQYDGGNQHLGRLTSR